MTNKKDLQSDINFIFEMGSIRFIERTWRRFLHEDFANLAEHHFRVFWIAMMIASHEKNVDTGKIAKMTLVHDIAESRTGDVDYLSRQYVERNEKLGIQDMLSGTALQKEFYELWEEYEERISLEAKIVKDADNLDVDFELAEQAAKGSQLPALKQPTRDVVADTKLYTDTARKMYAQLKGANPHEWHHIGRNRINSGDWKQ
ncbi:MAG TPA: HD domain-containing protein [Candidatus Saccharimonadales bacterium]